MNSSFSKKRHISNVNRLLESRRFENLIMEQPVPMKPALIPMKPELNDIILKNKRFFGLPPTPQITPEYTKKMSDELSKKGVGESERSFLGSASNLIPVWSELVDIQTIINGLKTRNKSEILGGIFGLAVPLVSYKFIESFLDYANEKLMGKEFADYMSKAMEDIINMTDYERQELFKRYGRGGYDKWVKDGRPPL